MKHSKICSVLAVFILLGILFSGLTAAGKDQTAFAESGELSAADIYEKNVAATVGITISGQKQTPSIYGYGYTYQASGSGFVISEDGYILTNYHVIENSDTITVVMNDKTTYDAKIIGYDESSDIAVIKIEAEGLSVVTMGNSDELRVGDDVYAIGNPLGELTFSMTRGIVSALSRNVRVESGNAMHLIQTDCAINSGNSGGALFNKKGEVIGITNAKYSSSGGGASVDNIGFAIPVNSIKRIVSGIIETGFIVKPYIGISVSSLSDETISVIGIKSGAWVREVTDGTPAADGGIKVNDIIVKVNEKEITSSDDLVAVVAESEPGDTLHFHIYRQGKEMELDITIGLKKEAAIKQADEASDADNQAAANSPGNRREERKDYPYDNGGRDNPDENTLNEFFDYFYRFGY